jgi:molybdopterin-guanine dinucleotide biosynthesis protein A
MGRDKALLPFGGYETLAEYQYDRLKRSGCFSGVFFSLKEQALPFDAPYLRDESETAAPIVALKRILSAASQERVFVLAVDLPFFSGFERLIAQRGNIAMARTISGSHPLCAIYHQSLADHFRRACASGDLSIKNALRSEAIAYVDFDERELTNLNYEREYRLAFNAYPPVS